MFKKEICIMLSVCLSLSFVCGCKSNTKSTSEIPKEYQIKELNNIDKVSAIQSIDQYNDNVYITGYNAETNLEINILSKDDNTKEQYVIPEIDTHDDINNIIMCSGKTCDYIINRNNDSGLIYLYDREKQEITDSAEYSGCFISDACTDKNDNLVLSKIIYEKQEIYSTIQIYDNNLASVWTSDIRYDQTSDHKNNICSLISDNKNIFALCKNENDEYSVIKISSDNDVSVVFSEKIKDIYGDKEKLLIGSSGDILFSCYDNEAGMFYVNSIDYETMKTVNMYNVEDADTVSQGIIGYDLIFLNNNKAYGYNLESEAKEEIIDLGENPGYINTADNKIINVKNVYKTDYKIIEKDKEWQTVSISDVELLDSQYIADTVVTEDGMMVQAVNNALNTDNYIKCCRISEANNDIQQKIDCSEFEMIYAVAADSAGIFAVIYDYSEDKYRLIQYDINLNEISQLHAENIKTMKSIFVDDGALYMNYADNNGCDVCSTVDFKSGKISDNILKTNESYDNLYSQTCRPEYNYVYNKMNTFFSYSVKNKTSVKLFNAKENNINNIDLLCCLSTEDMIAYSEVDQKFYYISTNLKKESNDTEKLIIATDYADDISDAVDEFNKKNDKYSIELKEYRSNSDTEAGINDISTDIISGNIPDIVVAYYDFNIDIFENKDALADLSGYMESNNINSENYFTNIFNSCSQGASITKIVPSFTVDTVIARTSDAGADNGWSYEDFIGFVNNNNSGDIFYKGEFFNDYGISCEDAAVIMMSDYLRDSKINTLNNNYSETLKILSEYCRTLNDNDSQYDKEELENLYYNRFIDNKCILDIQNIKNMTQICDLRYGYVNDTITFKGLPSDNTNGSYVKPEMQLAITESCKNKDAAWEFISQFIGDEYQQKVVDLNGSFPVKKSAFTKMTDNAQQHEIQIGNSKLYIQKPDQELITQINEWISSLSGAENRCYDVNKIIKEQIHSLCDGNQSAEVTTDNLRKKLSLYLSETGN